MNLFEKLQNLTKSLDNPNKNYWEQSPMTWDNNVLGPDGQQYDEESLYEAIKESNKKRLIKFG